MTPAPAYDPAAFNANMRGVNPSTPFYAFDFEVLDGLVLCCLLNLRTGAFGVHRGSSEIGAVFGRLVSGGAVLIGWNSWGYDRYIASACMEGASDRDILALSAALITGESKEGSEKLGIKRGAPFDRRSAWCVQSLKALVADIGLDIGRKTMGGGEIVPAISLKEWERRNGIPVAKPPVDFGKTGLTEGDVEALARYCKYDVTATALAVVTDPQGNIASKALLIEENNADPDAPRMDWSMTDQKLGSVWLRASRADPGDWEALPPTLPLQCMPRNPEAVAFFSRPCGMLFDKAQVDGRVKKIGRELKAEVCGVAHTLGVGGLHGDCGKAYVEGDIWSVDAASLYPYVMAVYNLVSRGVPEPGRFWRLIAERVVFKRDKNPKEKSRKKVLVSTYGGMGGEFSDLYSPREAVSVCVVGQLLFVHLLERLEPYISLIQSNTDGIMFTLKDPGWDGRVRTILKAFEWRSGLVMETEKFTAMHQNDVNNYVAVKPDGRLKCKGALFSTKFATVQSVDVLVNIANALRRDISAELAALPLERFARTFKCDKNHTGFSVNGTPTGAREVQCVAVRPHRAQRVAALRKDGAHTSPSGLWPYARLLEDSSREDVDVSQYGSDALKPTGQQTLF